MSVTKMPVGPYRDEDDFQIPVGSLRVDANDFEVQVPGGAEDPILKLKNNGSSGGCAVVVFSRDGEGEWISNKTPERVYELMATQPVLGIMDYGETQQNLGPAISDVDGNPTFLSVSNGDVAQIVYVDEDGHWAFAG